MAESIESYLARPEFAIPASELEHVAERIRAHLDHYVPDAVQRTLRELGIALFCDPFGREVADSIAAAVKARRRYSVVRIGDGEANILSWGRDPATPAIDRYGVARLMSRRADRFAPDDAWMLALREMMLSAILQADIVGMIGLWRPTIRPRPEVGVDEIKRFITKDPRGLIGHWRAVDQMLRLGALGFLQGKALSSAHLYLGVLRHLPTLLAEPQRVLLISNRTKAMDALERRYPDCAFERIVVGAGPPHGPLPPAPDFLATTEEALPRDLSGSLCLVGAGPWAEIYCGWIKQRGGVGVDIGSGFDLLEGRISRPMHRTLGLDKANEFALEPEGPSV